MQLSVTDNPTEADDDKIITGTRDYNAQFVSKDFQLLSVYIWDSNDEIVAGLTGKTFGNWLHVEFLWVSEEYRGKHYGSQVLLAAEREAAKRGCIAVTLDTFSFQALNFYQKQGYEVLGTLENYYGSEQRHYLQKQLSTNQDRFIF